MAGLDETAVRPAPGRGLGRIAVLGNMNNLGFSLMRYFRDLGEDAHLLLYANDGYGGLSHFVPKADTWHLDRWKPFIHQTGVFNWTQSLVVNPRERTWPCSKRFIRDQLSGYDTYLGSGAAPAIFHRVGMHLDGFVPYAAGVEFLGAPELLNAIRRVWINRLSLRRIQRLQRAGIAATDIVFNAELGPTADTLASIDVPVAPLPIPLVYVGEEVSEEWVERRSREIVGDRTADLRIFCSSRIIFVNKAKMSPDLWVNENKNGDYVFRALKLVVERLPGVDVKLFLPEYGQDVPEAKALCEQLGISANVIWLPMLARRDLRCLMRWCHAAVGQFLHTDGIIWGGTGWEALAEGVPFIQRINFRAGEYEASFGHPLPPIMHADNPEEIAEALLLLRERPDRRREIAAAAREWFRAYNGHALARQWIAALRSSKAEPRVAGHHPAPS